MSSIGAISSSILNKLRSGAMVKVEAALWIATPSPTFPVNLLFRDFAFGISRKVDASSDFSTGFSAFGHLLTVYSRSIKSSFTVLSFKHSKASFRHSVAASVAK